MPKRSELYEKNSIFVAALGLPSWAMKRESGGNPELSRSCERSFRNKHIATGGFFGKAFVSDRIVRRPAWSRVWRVPIPSM